MSKSPIDLKVRLWAMLLILTNLVLPSIIINILLDVSLLITLSLVVVIFCSLVIWLINRTRHPLISECTRESLNFTFSTYLCLIIMTSIWIISYFGTVLSPSEFLTGVFAFSSSAIEILCLIYICLIVFASIQAARGNIYRYPLTIRFLE